MDTPNSTKPFWWPADAETHTDSGRCGRCGHSTAYHASVNGKGMNTGKCLFTTVTNDPCPCKSCLKVRRGKRVKG